MILSQSAASTPSPGVDARSDSSPTTSSASNAFVPARRVPEHDVRHEHQRIDRFLQLSVQRPAPGVAVVRMQGEIDLASIHRLTELVRQRMTAAVLHALVLDLSEVSFVSSHGIELLLHAQRRADQRGIDLYVIPEARCVRRLLDLTGLTDRFAHSSTVAEAVAAARN